MKNEHTGVRVVNLGSRRKCLKKETWQTSVTVTQNTTCLFFWKLKKWPFFKLNSKIIFFFLKQNYPHLYAYSITLLHHHKSKLHPVSIQVYVCTEITPKSAGYSVVTIRLPMSRNCQ